MSRVHSQIGFVVELVASDRPERIIYSSFHMVPFIAELIK
jgi:hypothetical protein